jgi:hypothetical protein
MGVEVGIGGVGITGGGVVVWVETIGVLDVVIVGFVSTRPICPV